MQVRLLASYLLISWASTLLQAQGGLVAYYPFETCDATDVSLNNSDGIVFGDPMCDCGVAGNALRFDGVDDYVVLAGNVESYFDRDLFSLSLYFRTTSNSGTHDILSKRMGCDFDHAFAIRYTPAANIISVELAEAPDKRTTFIETLDPGLCWIHLVVVKDDTDHRIYINGELLAQQRISEVMDLTSQAQLQIGNGPCIGPTDRRFEGLLDEVRVYNRPLMPNEIRELYLRPDRTESRDTSIYQGGTVKLRAGTSCASGFQWSPAGQVVDDTSPSTSATPTTSQTFTVDYQYAGCTATDTIRVSVIDPDDIECGQVPLPNAFTPNGDGRNDAFFISNPFSLESLISFEIFDRLGNKVFVADGVRDAWDGMYKGNLVNPGLFLYKIKYTCRNEELVKTGSVMVIR